MQLEGNRIFIDKRITTIYVGTEEHRARLAAQGWNAKLTNPSATREVSPQQFAAEQAEQKRQTAMTNTVLSKAANDQSNLWGEIVKDGKMIASIFKSGVATTPYYIPMKSDLPEQRAKEIIAHFGGTLKSAVADTSAALKSNPAGDHAAELADEVMRALSTSLKNHNLSKPLSS